MKQTTIRFKKNWRVIRGTPRSQAAEMVIEPNDAEGGPTNRHPRSDQWLYVVSGRGEAIINGRKTSLAPRALLLIKAGARHEIRNTGRAPLKTLNFYSPPAY